LLLISISLLTSIRELSKDNALKDAEYDSKKVSEEISQYFEERINTLKVSGKVMGRYADAGYVQGDFEDKQGDIVYNIIQSYPEVLTCWVVWESSVLLPFGFGEDSQISFRYSNHGGGYLFSKDTIADNRDYLEGLYYDTRLVNREKVSDIYYTKVWQDHAPTFKMTIPITIDGRFGGVLAVEISLHQLFDLLPKKESGHKSYLYNKDNQIIISNQADWVDSVLDDVNFDDAFIETITLNQPVSVGMTQASWQLMSVYDISQYFSLYNNKLLIVFCTGAIGFLLLSVVVYSLTRKIKDSVEHTTLILTDLVSGKTSVNGYDEENFTGELGEMISSVGELAKEIDKKTAFTKSLGSGHLDAELDLIYDEDKLSQALLSLQESLRKNEIEAKRRKWTNEGLTLFSDILRGDNLEVKALSTAIISNLVSYMKANQGAIFLLNDEQEDDKHLELVSAYAYERRKYMEKRIGLGEGLAGQCAVEKETIHMTEVPEDHINITSGLGKAVPRSLLIVPLKKEEEIVGVIELGSFNPFTDYEIELVEKLGENIALTISSTRINTTTRQLLEQSQIQQEELSSAQEEMRQNMEELQATQEELGRRAKETEKLLEDTKKQNKLNALQIEISNKLSMALRVDQVYSVFVEEIGQNLEFDFCNIFGVEFVRGKRALRSLATFYVSDEGMQQPMIEASKELVFKADEGVIGLAYTGAEPYFVADVIEHEGYTRNEAAKKCGLRAAYFFPIFSGKNVTAVTEIYMRDQQEIDDLLIKFLKQMGGQLGEVLARVKLTEVSAQEKEDQARWQYNITNILDGVPYGIAVINEEGGLEEANKPMLKYSGYRNVELKRSSFFDLFTDDISAMSGDSNVKTQLKTKAEELIDVEIRMVKIKKDIGERRMFLIENLAVPTEE